MFNKLIFSLAKTSKALATNDLDPYCNILKP
jgi:hypothetical protein